MSDCPNSEYPELDNLINKVYEHLTNCFPKVKISQQTVTYGHVFLVGEDSIELEPTSIANKWTATCEMCGWTDGCIGIDNVPAWEDLDIPQWEEGGDEHENS